MIDWYYFALTSAFFSAGAALIEKKILFKEKALPMTALLAIFNLLLVVPFFLLTDFSTLTFIGLFVLFIKSILGAAAFLCVMYGIKNIELSSALPLLVLTPGLVAIFAFLILGESLSLIQIAGIVLLLIGTYALQLNKKQKLLDPFKNFFKQKGYRYIIYALILFTITSILDKALLKNFKVPPMAFMGFQHLFLAIIFIAILLFTKEKVDFAKIKKGSIYLIFALSVITIIYRYSQIVAVKQASVALVLSIKRISVFFSVLIGGKIFHEGNLKRKIISTTIMILGAVLVINF